MWYMCYKRRIRISQPPFIFMILSPPRLTRTTCLCDFFSIFVTHLNLDRMCIFYSFSYSFFRAFVISMPYVQFSKYVPFFLLWGQKSGIGNSTCPENVVFGVLMLPTELKRQILLGSSSVVDAMQISTTC